MHQEHSRVRILSAQPTSLPCARLSETLRQNCEKARQWRAFLRLAPPGDGLCLDGMANFGRASPFAISGVAPRLLALHYGKAISAHTCRKDIAAFDEQAGEIIAVCFLLTLGAISDGFVLIPINIQSGVYVLLTTSAASAGC